MRKKIRGDNGVGKDVSFVSCEDTENGSIEGVVSGYGDLLNTLEVTGVENKVGIYDSEALGNTL